MEDELDRLLQVASLACTGCNGCYWCARPVGQPVENPCLGDVWVQQRPLLPWEKKEGDKRVDTTVSGIWKCVPLGSVSEALASRTSPSRDGQSNLPLLSEPGICFRSTATCYGALRSVLLLVTPASIIRSDISLWERDSWSLRLSSLPSKEVSST